MVLFHPPSESFDGILESREPFLPADEAGTIRIIARRSIACLAVAPRTGGPEDDGLPLKRRRLRVRLSGGTVLEGEIRFVVVAGAGRTVDFLNQTARSFTLFGETSVFHVAKAHTESVEEVE